MVDPVNFTNYNRTDAELEETLLFSICVAGKNAMSTARAIEKFLSRVHTKRAGFYPFKHLREYSQAEIVQSLWSAGIGCQTIKGRGIYELVNSGLDLRTCTEDDLDAIYGIGLKTATLFLMHTRKGYRAACLDVHILRHLKKLGYDVPKTTPGSKKKYKEIQTIFLKLADEAKMLPADYDLALWREYSGHAEEAA